MNARPRLVIGLTGSVGMGKSTTAGMFAESGIPVWNADDAVHRLYARGGAAVTAVGRLFPDAIRDGAVDREVLRSAITRDPTVLPRLEAMVHPLVAADRAAFLAKAERDGAEIAVLDVPLLFETGLDSEVDVIVVASAPPEVQRERVLARPGMTEADLAAILARQMPDAEKRARADYVVQTIDLEGARRAVNDILTALRKD
jgi:dephospho-CoA kinase